MNSLYSEIVRQCTGKHIALEPLRGRTGIVALGVSTGEKYFSIPKQEGWDEFLRDLMGVGDKYYCYDVRRMMEIPKPSEATLYDLRTVYRYKSLMDCVRRHMSASPIAQKLTELEQRVQAHTRAAKTAQVEVSKRSLDQMLPKEFLEKWLMYRTKAVTILGMNAEISSGEIGIQMIEFDRRKAFISALHDVELAGIRVDEDLIEVQLKKARDKIEESFFRSLQGLNRGGFVTSLFNPIGGKTGRVKIEGGFNCMGVPKSGACRTAIISRHIDGKIYSYDFNAIDYRSIVRSIGGEFAALYRGWDDFHTRTLRFLHEEPYKDPTIEKQARDAIKFISYVYIYGGSEESLVAKTGMSPQIIRGILKRLDQKIGPIKDFREKLFHDSKQRGFVELPSKRKVYTSQDDHAGKVLGLYAQSYSSEVFEDAFVQVNGLLRGTKSTIIFPVHDELVIDMHPEDIAAGTPLAIKRAMQGGIQGTDFVVKFKSGRNYGEVE